MMDKSSNRDGELEPLLSRGEIDDFSYRIASLKEILDEKAGSLNQDDIILLKEYKDNGSLSQGEIDAI